MTSQTPVTHCSECAEYRSALHSTLTTAINAIKNPNAPTAELALEMLKSALHDLDNDGFVGASYDAFDVLREDEPSQQEAHQAAREAFAAMFMDGVAP